jgi:SAM-dependent methyltransferase
MSAYVAIRQVRSATGHWSELALCCPVCSSEMEALITALEPVQTESACTMCNSTMLRINGIWRAMRPGRASLLSGMLSSYEAVRKAEGRWSDNAEFYLSLPFKDTTGRFVEQWKIRARSFQFIARKLLPICMRKAGKERLRILDIGSGNCWMSYRLSLAGHLPVAADLSVSPLDGLGAARHYGIVLGSGFPCFQAEMDRLPFTAGQFDVVIFNASFHYARDYEVTLRETLRVLRPGGAILIVDSPTYSKEADGEAMKREKSDEFLRRYGTDGGNMGGQEYLTPERLARLEKTGIRWRRYSLWRGWRWTLRPFLARIAGRRRPSQFHIYLGAVTTERTEER